MAHEGRVSWDRFRGWHVDFRAVAWPGATKGRRIRINQAPGYGRFKTEQAATDCLLHIRAQCLERPLYDVLSAYLKRETPENSAIHRWNYDFLPELARRHRRGRLSEKRYRELGRYEGRGHLEFWRQVSIHAIDEGALYRWVAWLEEEYPTLSPRTIKHLVADFGTFLRWERRLGTIQRVPELPTIDVPAYQPKVPTREDLERILAEIPHEIRGLWLARSLAGLRPSEARRLDVADYDLERGELRIPPEKSKTKRGRILPIRQVVPELDEWIRELRADARPWEPLFVSPQALNAERRWRPTTERLVWIAALERAGLEHIRPNEGGRHAFATHEIGDGTDPYAVKDWLGHASRASTERYNDVAPVTLARRMRPKSRPTPQRPSRRS